MDHLSFQVTNINLKMHKKHIHNIHYIMCFLFITSLKIGIYKITSLRLVDVHFYAQINLLKTVYWKQIHMYKLFYSAFTNINEHRNLSLLRPPTPQNFGSLLLTIWRWHLIMLLAKSTEVRMNILVITMKKKIV